MQGIYVFFEKAKFAKFWPKKDDVSRTQGICHVIYTFISWF